VLGLLWLVNLRVPAHHNLNNQQLKLRPIKDVLAAGPYAVKAANAMFQLLVV
jgi:hypothetical protein